MKISGISKQSFISCKGQMERVINSNGQSKLLGSPVIAERQVDLGLLSAVKDKLEMQSPNFVAVEHGKGHGKYYADLPDGDRINLNISLQDVPGRRAPVPVYTIGFRRPVKTENSVQTTPISDYYTAVITDGAKVNGNVPAVPISSSSAKSLIAAIQPGICQANTEHDRVSLERAYNNALLESYVQDSSSEDSKPVGEEKATHLFKKHNATKLEKSLRISPEKNMELCLAGQPDPKTFVDELTQEVAPYRFEKLLK